MDGPSPLCPAGIGRTEPESERGPIRFHMEILDGVYVDHLNGSARFHWVSSPITEPSVGVGNWPKFAAYSLVTGVRLGHFAAADRSNLSDCFGEFAGV